MTKSRAFDGKERFQGLLVEASIWMLLRVVGKQADELVGTCTSDEIWNWSGKEVWVLGFRLSYSAVPSHC